MCVIPAEVIDSEDSIAQTQRAGIQASKNILTCLNVVYFKHARNHKCDCSSID